MGFCGKCDKLVVDYWCPCFPELTTDEPNEETVMAKKEINRETLLSAIAGFPAGVSLNWNLGKLLDRVTMVAQFDCGRYTFEEAMLEAFRGVVEEDGTALACRDAVMDYLQPTA